jgi:hypothetical protein
MSISDTTLKDIFSLVKSLRFGEVIIKVQDARIVSVEKREKIRLKSTADSPDGGEAQINT